MTPDYFRDLLLTHFVPPVLGLMLLGAAAGLLASRFHRGGPAEASVA